MTTLSRNLLIVCMCLLFVGAWNEVASAGDALDECISDAIAGINRYGSGRQEDPDDIVDGAIAYIDKYQSGRIKYTYEVEMSPFEITDEQIETYLRIFVEQHLRKRGDFSEEQISERLDKERASLEKQRSKKEWTKISGKCEVVFVGDNQHVTSKLSTGKVEERYDYNGNCTCVEKSIAIPVDKTKPPIRFRSATVWEVEPPNEEVLSVLDEYRYVRRVLEYRDRNWVLLGTKEEKGETVYVLADTTSNGVFKFFVEIVPEKGYYIKKLGVGKKGHEPVWTERLFRNPTWNADAQIYYPRKFMHDMFQREPLDYGQKYLASRRTLTQTDVDFNINVPDKTFHVPMQENLNRVRDYRSDPIKGVSYSKPDEIRRLLADLNGLPVKEPARSETTQKPSGLIDAKPRTEREFADEALKLLNENYPDSFEGVTVKNKSRMELHMKEGEKTLDTEALEQIAAIAVRAFQEQFDASSCMVVIRLGNGKAVARGRYRRGEFSVRVY